MALSPETAPQDRPPEDISAFLSSSVAPSASEIRRQLARILSSSAFVHAQRLSRFLRFVVEETLEGRDEQIKGYVLALEVFDRPDSFDPRLDSIVRVEACRLRAKIKSYYENDGQNDPVVIQIPPGSYIPTFRTRERSGEPRETDQSQGSRGASRPHWKIPAVLLLLLICLALGGIFVHIGGLYQENSAQAEERGQSSQPDLSSVAVLPFLDLSRERNLEYLCHGIAQEIISVLTRVPGLRVASLTSAFRFQVGREDVRTIGQNLNVGAVLEGSIRKAGDRVRITAQLTNAGDGYQLWSDSYESDIGDIFSIQDQVSQSIVSALKIEVARQQLRGRRPTDNLEAYNLYLKGRFFQNKRNEQGLRKSIEYFQESGRLDPDFALAYAGLADSHALLASGGIMPAPETMPEAKAAALRALRLDETLGEVYASLGFIRSYWEWDWEGALADYRRATELNPGYATAYQWYAGCLRALGRLEEAEKAAQKAQQLDPLSPVITRDAGRIFRWLGQHDRAVAEFLKALELDPGFASAYLHLGLAYLDKSMHAQAMASFQKACEMRTNEECLGILGYSYATWGKHGEARKVIEKLQELSKQGYVPPTSFAFIYIGLGEKNEAFKWLEKACQVRDPVLSWLKVDPIFDTLRVDPRFPKLLARVNLGPAVPRSFPDL